MRAPCTAFKPRHVLPLLGETVAEARRKRGAVPQAEVLPLLGEVPAGGPDQAVQRQQALDAVDDPRPIPLRRRSGAVQRAAVFFLSTRNPDDTPPLPFPSHMAQEQRAQLRHVQPSRLGPPGSAMDCHARRVDRAVVHPLGHSPTVAPEAVPACLVTAQDRGSCGEPKALLACADLFPACLKIAGWHVAFPGTVGCPWRQAELPWMSASCKGQQQCQPVARIRGNAARRCCGHELAPFS
jgi:hypothetical protein